MQQKEQRRFAREGAGRIATPRGAFATSGGGGRSEGSLGATLAEEEREGSGTLAEEEKEEGDTRRGGGIGGEWRLVAAAEKSTALHIIILYLAN